MSPALIAVFAIACGAMVANLYYAQALIGLIAPDIGLAPRMAGLTVTLTQLGYGSGLQGSAFGEATAVFGDHTYSRVNPSIGMTFTPSKALTLYANYSEGSRAPTVIELGCSNPAQPCGLPNNFAGDPDLNQVVARTFEVGTPALPSAVHRETNAGGYPHEPGDTVDRRPKDRRRFVRQTCDVAARLYRTD